jgi:hypothetical protein
MSKILITGSNSNLAKQFIKLIPSNYKVTNLNKKKFNMNNLKLISNNIKFFQSFNMIFFFHAVIGNKRLDIQKSKTIIDSLKINLVSQVMISEISLNKNKNSTIFFVGSESGIKGSYDIMYGLSKSSIHHYVKERKIKYPNQRILCISPSTIIDSNLTLKRKDQYNVKKSIAANPKKRGLRSDELARVIANISFNEEYQYLTNTVIEFNGGKFARS